MLAHSSWPSKGYEGVPLLPVDLSRGPPRPRLPLFLALQSLHRKLLKLEQTLKRPFESQPHGDWSVVRGWCES